MHVLSHYFLIKHILLQYTSTDLWLLHVHVVFSKSGNSLDYRSLVCLHSNGTTTANWFPAVSWTKKFLGGPPKQGGRDKISCSNTMYKVLFGKLCMYEWFKTQIFKIQSTILLGLTAEKNRRRPVIAELFIKFCSKIVTYNSYIRCYYIKSHWSFTDTSAYWKSFLPGT